MHYKNVLVLRSNENNIRWKEILNNVFDEIKVVVVFDNSKSLPNYPELDLVLFNNTNVDKLGLMSCDDMTWRFGDYVFYLVSYHLKNKNITFDYIWLVEPDVFLKKNIIDIISSFNDNPAAFLTTYFSDANDSWNWSKYTKDLGLIKPYKTFFPFVRVNRKLVEFLYDKRLKTNTLANDEVFVASFLGSSDFSVGLFSELLKYNRNSFSYGIPHFIPFIKYYPFRKSKAG